MNMLHPVFAFMGVGTQELLIIGVIAVLLFGTRLPKIARSLGQSVTEFKKGVREIESDVDANSDPDKVVEAKKIDSDDASKS